MEPKKLSDQLEDLIKKVNRLEGRTRDDRISWKSIAKQSGLSYKSFNYRILRNHLALLDVVSILNVLGLKLNVTDSEGNTIFTIDKENLDSKK